MNTRTRATQRRAAPRSRQRGFTLMEVIVALVIVAGGTIALLATLGSATESAMQSVDRRKIRYLAQIVLADVEVGKISPTAEEERYEEGTREAFAGWGSAAEPDEYASFEYEIEALRDELVTSAGADPEQMQDAGFQQNSDGTWSRPVSNDSFGFGEEGEEEPPPTGPMKRLAVIAIRKLTENPAHEVVLRIMTYLPAPDEESQSLGPAGAAGLPGAAGATPGGETRDGASGAAGRGSDRK